MKNQDINEQNPSNSKIIELSKLHHCLSFSNIMMTVLVYAWFSTVLIAASPLPGILEYQQQIVLKCASAEDAAKVELVPLPLPDNAPIAFSARWDDCNMKHLDTLAVMAENGVKGTFFLNDTSKRFGTDYCKKLLSNGCSIGAHTLTHPFLPAWNANEQFYEIMSVRIQRESDSDSILSTMVLPYCQYKKFEDPQIQLDIGQSMMNSGFIGAPEPFYGHYGKDLNYPPGTLAESALIRPGDRDVNPEKSDKDIHKYLAAKDRLKENPALTIGIHSWHTPDGLKQLDKILKQITTEHKNWWFCNQNEYAAYRYEANNCKIHKTVKGNDAFFTITRFKPESLGANVPLWFKITGCSNMPQAVLPAIVDTGKQTLKIPHAISEKLPDVIATAEPDGHVVKIPSVKCRFSVADNITPRVTLENTGKNELTNVVLTLRFGSGFTPGVICKKIADISSGKSYDGEWQLKHDKAIRYNIGRPYYVAQFDFNINGKRYRLYAQSRGNEDKEQPLTPAKTFLAYAPVPDGTDLRKMSMPETSPASFNLKKATLSKPEQLSSNALAFLIPKDNARGVDAPIPLAAIVDFTAVNPGNITLNTNAAEVYLNGAKLNKGNTWILPAIDGVNRMVLLYKVRRPGSREVGYLFPQPGRIKEFIQVRP